ncbi:hypothetical protein JCM8097_003356 [Rhodosporidiobolus ruineniae]
MAGVSATRAPTYVFAVNEALSALSIIGGAAIIIGYALSSQRSALRQKLVLGLGVTDFIQAGVTLVGNALELSNDVYKKNEPACLANGFIYQTCVIANACWTLTIAATTYTTLVHPFSSATAFLERPIAYPSIALTIVLIAIAPTIGTQIAYDYVDSSGVCWLRPGTLPANLVLFIPRATTLVIVILLYLRLFVFFRRRDINMLDTTSYETEEAGERRGSKPYSLATLGRRLSAWSLRRSSEASRRPSAPANGGLHPPGSVPLSPIPGSPAIAFSQPFTRSSEPQSYPPPTSSRHAVTVSFPPSADESPTQSGDSSRFPDSMPSPTQPGAPPSGPPKRPSATSLPARFSIAAGADGTPSDSSDPKLEKGRRASRRRSLTPRQINKRLSLLMMVYPAAYCILVAVAVARLIQSFSRANAPAQAGLRYASAWCIYSQGAIDGTLFVLVSVVFKRWTSAGRGP